MYRPFRSFQSSCKAQILSRQVKSVLTVCKIGQKCIFVGIVISLDGDNTEPFWDTIYAKPAQDPAQGRTSHGPRGGSNGLGFVKCFLR